MIEKKTVMKIKAKIIVLFLIITFQFSCESWMELIPPQGLIREEFWKTKEDVEAVVMGAYETFANMDAFLFRMGEIRADMVTFDYSLGGDEKKMMESDINPENWLCKWGDFYKVINYCNEVIKNAPLVKEIDNTFTDYQLKGYLSEAYYLRSLAYFYLVRIYKDVPYITEPTESDDADFYVAKTDGNVILDSILLDLNDHYLSATIDGYKTLKEIKGRVTRAAYDALLADISLWVFDYEAVITYVERIEFSETTFEYILMPDNNWFDIFYPGNSFESIFEFQFDHTFGQTNGTAGLTSYWNHNYDPSQKAIEMFGKEFTRELFRGEDNSIRKYGEDDFIIWKYVGRSNDGESFRAGAESSAANWIVYRFADVLLMKAEAHSQLGDFNAALTIIDEICARAQSGHDALSETKSAYEDEILRQRALELAFEGKRWFDLVRMGRRDDFARKSKLIEIIIQNVPSTQKRILASKLTNPLGWYLPIHEDEIERNKNLVQNPYYNF
jgi:starch-binding outer membrane protein, SusD/RagB family